MDDSGNNGLTREVLKPILYGDIFNYPLTFEEIYQFLEVEIAQEDVQTLLDRAVDEQVVVVVDGYYSLSTRPHLAATRRDRHRSAQILWPKAIQYGRWIAGLPFVHFVAVTGSLAVDNPREDFEDIDYLIVTRAGRLWLCRALTILLVKYGRRQGANLCPNYLITENVLEFDDGLFTAREILQMKPLYGREMFLKLRHSNAWVTRYFPHGNGPNLEKLDDSLPRKQYLAKQLGEFVLAGFVGNALEKWVQQIQMTKHIRQAEQTDASDKVVFTPDVCKGHYNSHNHRTMDAFRQRMQDATAKVRVAGS